MTTLDSTYTDKQGYTWTRKHANVWQREDGAQAYRRDLDGAWLIRHNAHRNPSNGWYTLSMPYDLLTDVLDRATWTLDRWQQIDHCLT